MVLSALRAGQDAEHAIGKTRRARLSPAGPLLRSLAALASPAAGRPFWAAPAHVGRGDGQVVDPVTGRQVDFVTIGNEMSVRTADSVELANRLRPVLLMLNRHLRREAHAEGITGGQAALLAQIRNHPNLGVRELAAREGISAPSMTRYLDRLERAGLIVRTRAPEDARRIRLALTPKGVRVLRSVRRRRTAWLAERLGSLSAEEQRAVAAAIEPLGRLLADEER